METTEQAWSLPNQGIKRKILEVLATVGGEAPGETVRNVLDYQGKNWRYFMADLVNRGLLERRSDDDEEAVFAFAAAEIQEAVIARMSEDDILRVRREIEQAEAGGSDSKEEDAEDADPAEELPESETGEAPAQPRDPRADDRRGSRREKPKTRTGDESGPELLRMTADVLRRGDVARTLEWSAAGIAGEASEEGEELAHRFRLLAAQASIRSSDFDAVSGYTEPIIADETAPAELRAVAGAVDGDSALQSGDAEKAQERLAWIEALDVSRDESALLHRALLAGGLGLAGDRPGDTLQVVGDLDFTPNDPMDRARVSFLRGQGLFALREYEQCVQPLQEALDIFRNRGIAKAEFSSALLLAKAFHSRAQFAKSDSMLDVATNLADGADVAVAKHDLAVARGTIYADRGDVDRLGDAVTQMESNGGSDRPEVAILGARLSSMKGYPAAAIDGFDTIVGDGCSPRVATEALREIGHCYRSLGRLDDAVSTLHEALAKSVELRDREEFAKAGIELVLAYLDRGLGKDATEAVVVAKKAIRLLEFVDAPDVTWRAYHALGRIYASQGRHPKASARIGQATEVLDQLLGRFQSRRDREEFLVGRYEAYRDWIVEFLEVRPYKVPLGMLRQANYPEFVEFLRTNADADSVDGPRYNEIGRLSQSFFDLYEKKRPVMPEAVEEEREALAALRRAVKVTGGADAAAIVGELLGETMTLLGARMGAAGIVGGEERLRYFKGRNLPGRKKSDTEPVRALLREVAEADREVLVDAAGRLNGPGEAIAVGYPLVGNGEVRGAVILWYPNDGTPSRRKMEFTRAMVALAQVPMTRTLAPVTPAGETVSARAPAAEALEAEDAGAVESAADVVLEGDESLKSYLERTERDLLSRAVDRYAGDIPAVAKALGFTAANLKKKLGRFGLGG